jgi:hypothetical protein
MGEVRVEELVSPDGENRVVIVRRQDGRFTYRRQSRTRDGWTSPTIDAGVYESPETAETEARQRVAWLRALFH